MKYANVYFLKDPLTCLKKEVEQGLSLFHILLFFLMVFHLTIRKIIKHVINLATKIVEKTLCQAIFQDLDFREEYNNNDSFANFRNKVVKKGAATFQFPAFMAFVIIIL